MIGDSWDLSGKSHLNGKKTNGLLKGKVCHARTHVCIQRDGQRDGESVKGLRR